MHGTDPTSGDLIPLEIAVQCIFSALYDDAATRERLTGLAQAVVVLVPIYVRSPDGDVSRVSDSQLREGFVRDGGEVMQFRDGRPALGNLFISSMSLENAIGMLAGPEVETDPPPGTGAGAWQASG